MYPTIPDPQHLFPHLYGAGQRPAVTPTQAVPWMMSQPAPLQWGLPQAPVGQAPVNQARVHQASIRQVAAAQPLPSPLADRYTSTARHETAQPDTPKKKWGWLTLGLLGVGAAIGAVVLGVLGYQKLRGDAQHMLKDVADSAASKAVGEATNKAKAAVANTISSAWQSVRSVMPWAGKAKNNSAKPATNHSLTSRIVTPIRNGWQQARKAFGGWFSRPQKSTSTKPA